MAKYDSNNPMLRKSALSRVSGDGSAMTRGGAIGKTAFLFILLLAGAGIALFSNLPILSQPFSWLAILIIGTALSFVTAFVPKAAPFTAPLYAICEGMLLGVISAAYGMAYNGIVLEAITATIGIFLMTLIFYAAGIIKVTNRFRFGVIAATFGVMFVYLADILFSFIGINISLFDGGIIGIAINLLIVIIASLNFMLDFDYFDKALAAGAPKYMEWYMGYSIMVTFVWLYLEILRLISRFSK